MKKYTVFFFLATVLSLSAMEKELSRSKCCGLDDACYAFFSKIGRNDYLYLALNGNSWFLEKK